MLDYIPMAPTRSGLSDLKNLFVVNFSFSIKSVLLGSFQNVVVVGGGVAGGDWGFIECF